MNMTITTGMTPIRLGCLLLAYGALMTGTVTTQGVRQGAGPVSAFAKTNLHAWAFEEYDVIKRTPAERAQLLKTLGITRAGFIGRNVTRMNEFDAYIAAYREQRIELVAVWSPVNTDSPLTEPHIKMFLDGVDRNQVKAQWWVTLEQMDQVPEAQRVEKAVTILRPMIAEANKRGFPLHLYGHGKDAWFTQPENEIAIIERLQSSPPALRVGIAYNFHHAHSQLDRFADMFPKLLPHLVAVNLDGMKKEGPMIIPIGEGDREADMIATIYRSGYRGAVGILAHTPTMDAGVVYTRNMEGLRKILTAIGDTAGAATYR